MLLTKEDVMALIAGYVYVNRPAFGTGNAVSVAKEICDKAYAEPPNEADDDETGG